MNIKGFRRMLLGEKMPDKNDPQYKERYEREVNAGRKFAQTTRIDKVAARVQGFANRHRKIFLSIVFGLVFGILALNIYWLTLVYNFHSSRHTTTEMQDSLLRERHKPLQHPDSKRYGDKEEAKKTEVAPSMKDRP